MGLHQMSAPAVAHEARASRFGQWLFSPLGLFRRQTVAFNEMAGSSREQERSRVAIEKYMSPKVYQLIQNGQLKLGGESREITVFKTDIRDFTGISERMEPQRLVAFLNRYFERVVAPVAKYDGEVDKYMGDAILAKFGATEWYPDHARRAVLAMIEMIEACEEFSQEAEAEGLPPIRMGIGANSGPAVVGNIGSPARMEYTIISSAVNTAQRIEELCKEFGWDILISRETYERAKDVVEVGTPWDIQLRGHSATTTVYPVLGRAGQVPIHRLRAYGALRLPAWYLRRVAERATQVAAIPGTRADASPQSESRVPKLVTVGPGPTKILVAPTTGSLLKRDRSASWMTYRLGRGKSPARS